MASRLNSFTDPRSTLFNSDKPAVDNGGPVVVNKNPATPVAPVNAPVEINTLDSYRSVTYNFILSAVSPDMLKDPNQEWRKSPLKYVIASSKGKAANAISSDTAKGDNIKLVQAFNQKSPGAFDLFIDNVEIDTIMAPSEQTGPALGTKVAFEVYEPFSVNGFIEALHASAIAAGWDGYLNGSFVLKIEFVGFPDKETKPTDQATLITEKYVPVKIVGVDIDVTEQGTRYKVKGIPVNELAHANYNKLTVSKQMTGATVGEVLTNLAKGLSADLADRAKKEKKDEKLVDSYEILFPKQPDNGQSIDLKSVNEISKKPINKTLTTNNVYQFKDLKEKENNPKGTDPQNKYDAQNSIVQFPVDADILDIITAVIRDSEYVKDLLKKVKDEAVDDDGMIDYFQIVVNAIPTGYDDTNSVHCYKYQYLVVPYKVHTSKLPDQQFNKFSPKQFNKILKRSYDYFYGGHNVDVLNFKLHFNNLYFQAANANQGNKPVSETSNAVATNGDEDKVKKDKQQAKDKDKSSVGVSGSKPIVSAGKDASLVSGAHQDDPYWQLSYNAHQSILESVNLINADIDIMGDPYYLCTSGMGNYLPKIKDLATTSDGEANFTATPVVIRFNFRNPTDIGPDGYLVFGEELTPFSGLYQIVKCVSKFNDGMFKQNLKGFRYQGQLPGDSPEPTKVAPGLVTEPNPLNTLVKDSAPADAKQSGVRIPQLNVQSLLAKNLPTNGLPGSLNNLIGGGLSIPGMSDFLSGASSIGSDLLSAGKGLLGNAADVFGGGGLGSIAGIAGQASSLLSNPLGAVSNLANGAISGVGSLISNPSSLLSQVPGVSQGLNAINQASNGLGLSVGNALSGSNPLISGIRADASVVSGVADQLKNAGASIADASSNMIANVTSIDGLIPSRDQALAIVNDAKASGISSALALKAAGSFGINLPNVSGLTPGALTDKLGIDPSQLSGLGGKLGLDAGKLSSQISDITKSLPENVNLGDAKKLGLSLGNLNKVTLQNIPAIPSLTIKAPDVEKSIADQLVDSPGDPKILAQFGMTPAMGALTSNIGGSLPNLDSLKSGLTGAIPSAGSLVADAQAGFGSSITSQLGSLAGGSPLDKLNIPSVDSLTAQASNLTSSISSNLGIG